MKEHTDLSSLKILVVEDDHETRALLRTCLHDMGIVEVFEADDGDRGLQFLENALDLVDLVLCDWNMPTMSGLDFLRRTRKIRPRIPFMMISGRGDAASISEAKGEGVDGYILKPYTPEQVETRMRAVLTRRKAA